MKHRNKSVKIYKIEFPEGEKGAKQKGGNMNTNFPGLKEDIKAQDKKANGVLNRTDKKTKLPVIK